MTKTLDRQVITWFTEDHNLFVEKVADKPNAAWAYSVEIDPAAQTITFTFDQGYKETYRLIKHGISRIAPIKNAPKGYLGAARFFAEVEQL